MKKTPVTLLRVIFADAGSHTQYSLQGPAGPLEKTDARMAQQYHQALGMAAQTVLARRAEVGHQVPYDQLFGGYGGYGPQGY